MKDKTKNLIKFIANYINIIAIFTGIIALIIFIFSQKIIIDLLISASILCLLSNAIKLIINDKNDKKIKNLGILLLIFTIIIGVFIIMNIIK